MDAKERLYVWLNTDKIHEFDFEDPWFYSSSLKTVLDRSLL